MKKREIETIIRESIDKQLVLIEYYHQNRMRYSCDRCLYSLTILIDTAHKILDKPLENIERYDEIVPAARVYACSIENTISHDRLRSYIHQQYTVYIDAINRRMQKNPISYGEVNYYILMIESLAKLSYHLLGEELKTPELDAIRDKHRVPEIYSPG